MRGYSGIPAARGGRATPMWLVPLLACAALVPAWLNFDIISMDGAFQYVPTAVLFAQGRFAEALARPQLPLFPLLMALLSHVSGIPPELAGRLIAAASFVLAAIGLFRVTQRLSSGRSAALLAAIFLITNPELVSRAVDCLKEGPFLALVIWGNYLILASMQEQGRRGRGALALGVVLLLLGVLVRTTALLFIAAWLIVWVFHTRQGRLMRFLVVCAPAVAAILVIVCFPQWGLFHRKGFAIFTYLALFPGLDGLLKGAVDVIGGFFVTGNPALILCALLGLGRPAAGCYRAHAIAVLAFFLGVTLFMGWTSDRYILAPIVWLYPAAAIFVQGLLDRRGRGLQALGWAVLMSCLILWGVQAFRPPDPAYLDRRQAGEWIRQQDGLPAVVVTNRPRIAYYAGVSPVLPDSVLPEDAWAAIDASGPQGAGLVSRLEGEGRRPVKVLGTIRVYSPSLD